MLLASAPGPRGLVEWPVVDGFAEVDLPGFGSTSDGVPGVESDEVVADEGDGEQHAGGDEPGLPEEPPVDTQSLEAVGAEQALDQAATIERECASLIWPRLER